ncbi:riboflavin kinase/FMN adenylyltransferase [Alkalibacillus flavidus]|uniref:Riboflavin biosynthesis protein n=1 Tax=Alkalibacillus flavidus TaxID=546021 RepID=A0ABV2KRG1_9BACI
MEVIELSLQQHHPFPALDDVSVAVGYFDGVHIGHRRVIETAKEEATRRGIKSGVMTFSPHPLTIIKNQPLTNYLITSKHEKMKAFQELNLDYVIVVQFDHLLAQQSPEAFVNQFLIGLNIQHVVGGFDFSFGHKGAGKIQQMDDYAQGRLTYSVVDEVSAESEKISSTSIREQIRQGQMQTVTNLLGRPFSIEAPVVKGYQRGREIGYPTANLDVDREHIIPHVGVYAIQVAVDDRIYDGMASVGFNPTFDDHPSEPVVEAHLFDFNESLYDQCITVYFLQYIRDEESFSDVDELVKRIEQDELEAKNFLQSNQA